MSRILCISVTLPEYYLTSSYPYPLSTSVSKVVYLQPRGNTYGCTGTPNRQVHFERLERLSNDIAVLEPTRRKKRAQTGHVWCTGLIAVPK